MGDLRVGQDIVDPEGRPSQVVGIYPQGVRDIYRVTLADGSTTETTADHLWRIADVGYRHKQRVVTTAWLAQRATHGKYRLPAVVAPDLTSFEADDLPVDPWLLGVLLGDGTLQKTSVGVTSVDAETMAGVVRALPVGVVIRQARLRDADVVGNWRLAGSARDAGGHNYNPLLRSLQTLGLAGRRSWEKSIPSRYLWNSAKVRLAVLQGLMDADGSVDSLGRVEFATVSRQLAVDVQFLVQSLGGKARICMKRNVRYTSPTQAEPKTARTAYVLRNIRFADQSTVPFRLSRKVSRLRTRSWQRGWNVAGVELVGQAEAQCIEVSAPSRLYVTDDWIPTHNTASGTSGSQRDGDGVWRRTRRTGIAGFGYPAYGGGPGPGDVTRRTQAAVHVAVDGDWGPVTDRAVSLVRAAARGSRGDVRATQRALGTTVDGDWGRASRAALAATVRALQVAWGVAADGDWGPGTDAAYAHARRRSGRGL